MVVDRLQLYGDHVGVEFVAGVHIDFDAGRGAGINRVPHYIHRVGAHVAHLADTEVPKNIPRLATTAGLGSREVLRSVRMEGRWADPLVVMEERGRLAFTGRVAGPAPSAGVPGGYGLEFANRPIQD